MRYTEIMFWNRNRKPSETHQTALPAASRQVVPMVERYRRGEVNQALLKLEEFMLALPHQPSATSVADSDRTAAKNRELSLKIYPRNQVYRLFVTLRKKLEAVDYSIVSSYDLNEITRLLNEDLPDALNEADTTLHLRQWNAEKYLFEQITETLTEAIDVVTDTLPTVLSQLNPMYVEPTVQEITSGFPPIALYEGQTELYAALKRLHDDWVDAQTMKLSTEGAFIIEQVAASYLPDALKLHTRLMGRNEEAVQNKAHGMLLEQVKLIHGQVQFVLSQHVDDSFSSMEAHMSFLKEKNNHLGIE